MTDLEKTLSGYMLDIDVPASKCPLEVLIAFPESLRNPDKRQKLEELWLCGNNKDWFNLTLMKRKKVECICRLTHVAYDIRHGTVIIRIPAGTSIPVQPSVIWKLGAIDEIVEKLSDYLLIKIQMRRNQLICYDIQPLYGVADTKKAKEILNKGVNPYETIVYGLGYKPEPQIFTLMLPRILSWFTGYDGKPMHIAQLTPPESGKSYFGLRSETLFNWEYLNEAPTPSRLVMDARNGALGIVYLRDGIVFDEFDKWGLYGDRVERSFDILLTGMEQGKWTRGTTKVSAEAPDIRRLLPIVFLGNSDMIMPYVEASNGNNRVAFSTFFTDQLKRDCRPLADRLSLIDIKQKEVRITEYLTNKVLPDSILRGIIRIIQERVKPCGSSRLKGRLRRHSLAIQSILTALQVEHKPDTVDSMVIGDIGSDGYRSEGGVVKRE